MARCLCFCDCDLIRKWVFSDEIESRVLGRDHSGLRVFPLGEEGGGDTGTWGTGRGRDRGRDPGEAARGEGRLGAPGAQEAGGTLLEPRLGGGAHTLPSDFWPLRLRGYISVAQSRPVCDHLSPPTCAYRGLLGAQVREEHRLRQACLLALPAGGLGKGLMSTRLPGNRGHEDSPPPVPPQGSEDTRVRPRACSEHRCLLCLSQPCLLRP